MRMQRNETILLSIIKNQFKTNKSLSELKANQKIFLIDSLKLAKVFKLFVGNERVESSALVTNLIQIDQKQIGQMKSDNGNNQFEKNLNGYVLKIPNNWLVDFFFKSPKEYKEPLAKTYLQAAYFVKLIKDRLSE